MSKRRCPEQRVLPGNHEPSDPDGSGSGEGSLLGARGAAGNVGRPCVFVDQPGGEAVLVGRSSGQAVHRGFHLYDVPRRLPGDTLTAATSRQFAI